jgi:plasmid stabilization system protein ParE
MSGFVLHPDALTDLNEIWEYIAADNPGAAGRVLEEIYEAIRAHSFTLRQNAAVGKMESDLRMRWRVELRSIWPFVQSSPTLVARMAFTLRPR